MRARAAVFTAISVWLIPAEAFACTTCARDQDPGTLIAIATMALLPMIVGFIGWGVIARQLKADPPAATEPQKQD